jgi:hypothetical protein
MVVVVLVVVAAAAADPRAERDAGDEPGSAETSTAARVRGDRFA